MKKSIITFAISLACLFTVSAQAQTIISVSFSKEVRMTTADSAGAETARTANWNSLEVKANTENPLAPIMDNTGKPISGLTLSVFGGASAGDLGTFNQKRETLQNDEALFNGCYDQNEGTPTRITLSGIPFAKYDIYIYRVNQEERAAQRAGQFKIGDMTYYVRGGGNEPKADGTGYVRSTTQAFTSGTDIAQGNYVKFEGLTGPSCTVEISAVNAGDAVQRCKIAGFQIVERP
jgi:hypothetical protein